MQLRNTAIVLVSTRSGVSLFTIDTGQMTALCKLDRIIFDSLG